MTDDLPPFSGDDPQCPKCSNHGATTEWQAPHRMGSVVLTPERLRRTCTRCSYEWPEALNQPTPGNREQQ